MKNERRARTCRSGQPIVTCTAPEREAVHTFESHPPAALSRQAPVLDGLSRKPSIINSVRFDLYLPSVTPPPLLIRPSLPSDLSAIRDIYAHAVLRGTSTFELDAPDAAEMARRHAEVRAQGLPWLVAESGGELLGYAYAGPFRPRPAYRFCVEDSIYLQSQA